MSPEGGQFSGVSSNQSGDRIPHLRTFPALTEGLDHPVVTGVEVSTHDVLTNPAMTNGDALGALQRRAQFLAVAVELGVNGSNLEDYARGDFGNTTEPRIASIDEIRGK